jgi:hypothetical protein
MSLGKVDAIHPQVDKAQVFHDLHSRLTLATVEPYGTIGA